MCATANSVRMKKNDRFQECRQSSVVPSILMRCGCHLYFLSLLLSRKVMLCNYRRSRVNQPKLVCWSSGGQSCKTLITVGMVS